MAILWCGGEDIDFPNGGVPSVNTSTLNFRSSWARCALVGPSSATSLIKSTPFPGGQITSAWLRFYSVIAPNGTIALLGALGKSGTNSAVGVGFSSSGMLAIMKISNGTLTTLATSTTAISSGRYDVQLINYGTTGTINLYVNGALVTSYTGDLTVTGATGLDSVFFAGTQFGNIFYSEFIVADDSTLALQGLATLAPTGNGTTQNFSNPAYTNFNPTTINDANSTFTNTAGQDEQATLNGVPSGSFEVKAVKVIARALATSGAATSNLKLGFNNTNNSTVAEGSSHALTSGFTPVEDYFATDPTTGAAWGSNLTGYQLELKSS